jgi:hypothetical protein
LLLQAQRLAEVCQALLDLENLLLGCNTLREKGSSNTGGFCIPIVAKLKMGSGGDGFKREA